MIEQRSDDWYNQRLGRFTASEAYELLCDGSRPMTDEEMTAYKLENPKGRRTTIDSAGESFYTLCKEKANEIVFGRDEAWNIDKWDMRRGRELEPEAFDCLKSILARKYLNLENCAFFPYGDHAGASPDGIILGKPICAEIKCPNPSKVFELILEGNAGIDKKHFAQMQMQMLCTNSDLVYYFNYAIWKNIPIFHLLEVERHEPTIEKIKERIEIGVPIVEEHVEELLKNKQF